MKPIKLTDAELDAVFFLPGSALALEAAVDFGPSTSAPPRRGGFFCAKVPRVRNQQRA